MRSLKLFAPVAMAILLVACNKYDIQPEQSGGFLKFYSSTLTETAYDVKQAADGGYVVLGTTTSENGKNDIYLVKTDPYGNEDSWSPAIIGGDYDDVGTSLQVVADGYIILGYSKLSDTSAYDMHIIKTDLQGEPVWENRTNNPQDEQGLSLQVTSGGDYLAVGTIYNPTYGNQRYQVALFREGETSIQSRFINIDPESSVTGAYIIEGQNNYFICGTERYRGTNGISLIQVDKNNLGAVNEKYFTSGGDLSGSCIQEFSDGSLLFSGTDINPQGFGSIYLNRVTAALESIQDWGNGKFYSETDDNTSLTGNAVRIISDDRFAIVGTRSETGNDDIILLHTDAAGIEVSLRIFGDEGFQQGISLEVTGSGDGLILVGNNGSEDNSMMALLRTDPTGKL
jgi:hypothetical protein